MSPAEIKLREAQVIWEEALTGWTAAQTRIREAKAAWSAAQQEFFTGIKVLNPYQGASCSGCNGCTS